MCDWHNCYNPGQYNISSITPPGGYETLYVYFSPNGIQGSGHCTVRINYQSTTIDQDFAVEGNPLGIKQISSVVKDFILGQNYPNPFNPTTKIRFSIPKGGYTTLKIFDINGQELENLISGTYPQGEFEVDFNASGLASGVYYYRLSSGGEISVKKMVLVK
jgi:hypothetical protein